MVLLAANGEDRSGTGDFNYQSMRTFVLETVANSVPTPRQRNATLRSALKSLSLLSWFREKDIIYDPSIWRNRLSSPVVLEARVGNFFSEYEEELWWLNKSEGASFFDDSCVHLSSPRRRACTILYQLQIWVSESLSITII
jgi:hypothetical protein